MIARAQIDPDDSSLVSEARELADRLDDPTLQLLAWHAVLVAALARGEYHEACAWSKRQVEKALSLGDPDLTTFILADAAAVLPYIGEFEEARELAQRGIEMSGRLSSHHRLHGASSLILLDATAGDWRTVRDGSERAESAFVANVATPCILGPIMLLTCALAWVHSGDDAEAQRLERVVADFGMEGYSELLDPPELNLAIARGDLATVERKLHGWKPAGLDNVEALITWLDALIALDRTAEIDEEAPALVKPGTYLEPFALRALGYARRDDRLIEQAIALFDGLGLEWFASQTRQMLSDARE